MADLHKQPSPLPMQEDTPQRSRIRAISAALFAEKGYNAVGISEIGEAVGLARGALYHHIGSKEELLYNIVIRYISDLVESGRTISDDMPDPVPRIRLLSRHLMRVIGAHINEMTVCFREVNCLTGERHDVVSQLHAEYQQIWAQAIEDGVSKGVFRPLPSVALKGVLGMYFYSFLWLDPSGRHRPEEIADIFSDLVFQGVAATAKTRRNRNNSS
ncbi:TetR/AcrR family transcriptional regulator [Acidocella sp.]|uniref:TetR/AcrR family transcriptional regulator n=1 Tax=Acidocella sp. TaxID=50710 RepID=UPI003CFCC7C8